MPLADLRIQLRSLLRTPRRNSSATSRKSTGRRSRSPCSACWRCSWRAPGPGATCCAPPIRTQRIPFLPLAAAYLAGAGINAVVPAHAGDVTKVFLVKRQIPDSSYPAVTSSFLVQTVFDTSVGVLVLLYAITQGLLPPLPRIPDLPAFEISFWADHPKTLAIVTVGGCCWRSRSAIYLLAHRVRRFWARVRQGVDHPRRAAPLPARGRRLAGGRLALPLRRLLVLPRGLRDRRLGRQRDAGDERAGDRQHHPLHPGRRRRPAGAPGRDPAAGLPAPPSSPSRSGPRSRWRPGRWCSASPRSCSSSGRPTGAGLIKQAQEEAEGEKAAQARARPDGAWSRFQSPWVRNLDHVSSTSRGSGRRRATARAARSPGGKS